MKPQRHSKIEIIAFKLLSSVLVARFAGPYALNIHKDDN